VGRRPTIWTAAIGSVAAVLPLVLSPIRSLERVRVPEPEELSLAAT
jgi:hypothetical protein